MVVLKVTFFHRSAFFIASASGATTSSSLSFCCARSISACGTWLAFAWMILPSSALYLVPATCG